jgi:anaerobic selenocysteine-containing dehydrogenase
LKLSAAAGAMAYVALVPGQSLLRAFVPSAPVSQQTQAEQEILYNNVCTNNCKQTCRIFAHVYQGRLVKTSPNPMPEPRYNRICLRGLTHVQRVYHPNRLKYPMKRVGARGSGQWQRISWDEAISTIAEQFNSVASEYSPKAVAFLSISGNYGIVNGWGGAMAKFANLYQGTILGVSTDLAMPLGLQQIGLSYYGGGNELADIADNARLVIIWGNNLTESDIHAWHFVADAIDNGAKIVTIDPHFSVIASKSNNWIHPRPGSDIALGMAIINVLINEHLYDEDFLVKHTVAPFLVRGDNGLFLREKDLIEGGSEKYMAWDAESQVPKRFDEVSHPALTGKFSAGNFALRPAFQLLIDRVAEFTPENTEHLTDIQPEEAKSLAREYANRKPASILANMGIDRWNNGHLMGRVLGTMAALTGNVGKPGATPCGDIAGFASLYVNTWNWLHPAGKSATNLVQALMYDAIINGSVKMYVPADPSNRSLGTSGPEPVQVPYQIKAIFSSSANWISNSPDQKKIFEQILSEDKIRFFVAADMFLTDTTSYADIVLPVSHWFEEDDIVSGYTHPFLLRQEKCLSPLWECKSDYEIFQLLAQKMGMGEYFQGTARDQVESILDDTARSLGSAGAEAIDQFRKTGAVRFSPSPYIGNSDLHFYSRSGRLEFYGEQELLQFPYGLGVSVEKGGDTLVRWEPPMEAWTDNALAKKYPLQCYQEHTKWRVHTTWFNQPWLREVDPEPIVKMNPVDAQARGIRDGDYVEVYNDRGHAVLKAVFNPAVRPGSLNIPRGWQRSQHRAGSYQELTNVSTDPVSLNFSFNDVLVEVRKIPSGMQLKSVSPWGEEANVTA